MKIKGDATFRVECELCEKKEYACDVELDYGPQFEDKLKEDGWGEFDGKTLCPRCMNIEKNMTPDRLEEKMAREELKDLSTGDVMSIYYCPNCGKELSIINMYKRCTACGQRTKTRR